jgi:branched-chain amino acid aminotransferase
MKTRPKYLLFDGELVAYEDARLHVLSTTLKYGVGVFEGYRAYWNEDHGELYAFRVDDHMRRLRDSLRLTAIEEPADIESLGNQLLDLIRSNDLRENLHMRVQVFVNSEDGTPDATGPALVSMAAIPMGSYFERPSLDVCVSSWARISERSMPPRVKALANYQNSRLALLEARTNGYDAALLLTQEGNVSEGPGYNVFIVRNGRLATPPPTEAILEGITRATVLELASAELGLEVDQRPIDRTELYLAEEVFVCGSAAEVSCISSVDRHQIGDGTPGSITANLQRLYRAAVRNELHDRGWTSAVYGDATRRDETRVKVADAE